MSSRKDFYFKQPVTQAELDAAFAYAEQAPQNWSLDNGVYGVITGLVATLGSAPTLDITKGIAYDQLGRRIPAYSDGASSKNISFATSTAGAATSVAGGQERWISIYASYGRQALDLRVDGNGVNVWFDQPENLHDGSTSAPTSVAALGGTGVDKFLIVAGVSAGTGSGVKPALLTNAVLICDVLRTPSDASNVLDTSRRMIYGIADTAAAGTGNGLAVIMSAFSTWLGGRTNPASANLHAQIDKIFTDLAAQTASDDGAERVGAQASGNLSAGSVRSQIDSLDSAKGGLSLANVWSAINTFSTKMRITPTQATAAIDYASAVATDARLMLMEFDYNRASQTNTKIRVYLNNKPIFALGPQRSILITQNAKWNGTSWDCDDVSAGTELRSAWAIEFGGNRSTFAASTNAYMAAAPIIYRATVGGTGNFTEFTGSGTQAVDFGKMFDVDPTQFYAWNSTLPAGINSFSLLNGEMSIGMSNAVKRIEFSYSLQATSAFTFSTTLTFGATFSGTPSSLTVTTGTHTNCAVGSAAANGTHALTLSSAVTAAGTFVLIGSVDVKL